VVYIAGKRCLVITQFAATIHARELRKRVATLADRYETITAAIDLLITAAPTL
jgi:hypothetical protein